MWRVSEKMNRLNGFRRACDEQKELHLRIIDMRAAVAAGTSVITGLPCVQGDGRKIEGYVDKVDELAALWERRENELLAGMVAISYWAENIDDSIVRQIVRHRFFDGWTWTKVGHAVNNSGDGCRMMVWRHIKQEVEKNA